MAKALSAVVEGRELRSAEVDVEAILRAVDHRRWGIIRFDFDRNDAIGPGARVDRVRVIKIEKRIHFGEEQVIRFHVGPRCHRLRHNLGGEIRVRDDPRRGRFDLHVDVLVVVTRAAAAVGEEVEGGGADDGVGGVEEGLDGDSVVALGEGVGGVDVGVAGDAEGGGVGLAGDGGGGLLADLADPHALVPRRQLVGAVDLGVAAEAEEGRVGSAEHCG
ncbi:hypothetical protein TorRG33x02_290670 [Trema orientale]|uniref:Uncharacterized protein n=1 Tax=Trema orientale TaxID=63057 RepID=A0A2P5CC11_TREOI|nr:hypothetical protein TorRG33x02_290670 [Trema orientale]